MKILYKIFSYFYLWSEMYFIFRVNSIVWRCRGCCLFLQIVPKNKLLKLGWSLVWFDDLGESAAFPVPDNSVLLYINIVQAHLPLLPHFPPRFFQSSFLKVSLSLNSFNTRIQDTVMWPCTRSTDITLNSLLRTIKGWNFPGRLSVFGGYCGNEDGGCTLEHTITIFFKKPLSWGQTVCDSYPAKPWLNPFDLRIFTCI